MLKVAPDKGFREMIMQKIQLEKAVSNKSEKH